MSYIRLLATLYLSSLCFVQSLAFVFDEASFSPAKFARDRYARSRNWTTTGRQVDPTKDFIHALDFVALVNNFGYPAEEHRVTTADGYKLRIHRIPGSPRNRQAFGKPVVFLQHGVLGSSDMWVLMGPNRDLAYILADAGYDVWLGNVRGNTYGRSHKRFSPEYNREFWQFSYHEMAMHDIPTSIDYILHKTNQSYLSYVGHSMGTTISYALLSTRPEYNQKINLVISLAPVAFWREPMRPFISFLKKNSPFIKELVTKAKINELFPLTTASAHLARASCGDGSILQQICAGFVYLLSGPNPDQLELSLLAYIFSYFPAGASTKTLMHFSQNIISGDFRAYDYGKVRNLARYKNEIPPSYNIKRIAAPVALIYGRGDSLVSPSYPYDLAKKLPNVVTVEPVPHKKFSHMDFLYSKDIKVLLNDRILNLINRFTYNSNAV
ncbi:lipase 3-like [Trichogramma pretiosum]|uniref:lipase 3-like n=1 Tax=Trichogramma pretiosum TaxID=7493 RepID=UPI0006C947FF|nr:lipase 3-like [Trichogramma pretiosum]